ncbi:hypothetical protein LAG90_14595 [Marinilongibacter aquaticus]|uniref:c-type cytochrome domain-containing protein n=1 Tax=Marinilongibacter aquaticus TaxID=2975157 RepID=UPI0021BD03C1|nr:c-type cytochrome domain-containing protein [Marinilongibacter aquaticus]UBM58033.1 hypothetical protein LAG90_14595 [Marinilongibacter aquaticus]
MLDLFGKLHPLLVHLPIGFLVLTFVLYLLSLKEKWTHIEQVIPLALAFTFVSAFFTCLTGYLLSRSGGYEAALVEKHKWAGIVLTLLSGLFAFVLFKMKPSKKANMAFWAVVLCATTFTGHWGGSLTHGENFLSFERKQERKPIKDINKAHFYADVVVPILDEKCYACHSASKQKGDLRLDTEAYISAGGEHGKVVELHASAESELYKRLLLPEVEKEHMPPKGKPQLTENETKALAWWIDSGLDFEKTVAELKPSPQMLTVLKSFEAKDVERIRNFPEEEVARADEKLVEQLKAFGVVVMPISKESNYLSVNFLQNDTLNTESLRYLEKLQDQIVWLKMDGTNVKDGDLEKLSRLKNLYILHLNHTEIGDAALAHLQGLKQLQSLNLSFTNVGDAGLLQLKGLPGLREVFVYKTKVTPKDWKGDFPKARIDTGNYEDWFVEQDSLPQVAQ